MLPFETLSCLLRDAVPIDLDSVQRKLLDERRGGYCFELNGGLLALLQALGFDAQPLSARAAGCPGRRPDRTDPPPLRVQVDGDDWLVDAGFGSLTPTVPLRLHDPQPQATPHERYLLQRLPGEGISCCTPNPVTAGGRCTVSTCTCPHRSTTWWATGTCAPIPTPASWPTARVADRAGLATHHRQRQLHRVPPGQAPDKRPLHDVADVRDVLQQRFGMQLPEDPRLDPAINDWLQRSRAATL